MSDSWYRTSVFVWALHRWGTLNDHNRPGVRRLLRCSDLQLDKLIAQAESYGLVRADDEGWILTRPGETFGSQVGAAVEEARLRSRTFYRPFDSYLPSEWLSGE